MYQVFKEVLSMQKTSQGDLFEVDRNMLEDALRSVHGSLSQEEIQKYNL